MRRSQCLNLRSPPIAVRSTLARQDFQPGGQTAAFVSTLDDALERAIRLHLIARSKSLLDRDFRVIRRSRLTRDRSRSMLADRRLGSVIGEQPPTRCDDWLR